MERSSRFSRAQRGVPLVERIRQAILFNPAFVSAACLACILWAIFPVELPSPSFDPERPVEVVGRIISPLRYSADQMSFRVTPVTAGQADHPVEIFGDLDVYIRSSLPNPRSWFDPPLQYGDSLRIRTNLREPAHYDVPGAVDARWLRWVKGRYFYFSLKSPLQVERTSTNPPLSAIPIRLLCRYLDRFLVACGNLEAFPAGLLHASIAGDSRELADEEWGLFQRLGLVHLLVVSGFHVALLALAARQSFGRLGQLGSVLRLGLIWAFVAVTGAASPVLRAALTLSLFLLSSQFALRARPYNLLGVAALVLLVDQPRALYSRSFQFTFAAVLAILGARPAIRHLRSACRGVEDVHDKRLRLGMRPGDRVRRKVRFTLESRIEFLPVQVPRGLLRVGGRSFSHLGSLLVVCALVQLTLLPLILFHNNQVSLSAVLNNLVMVPLFGTFLVLGFLYLGLFWTPFGAVLAATINHLAGLLRAALEAMDSINLTACAPSPHPLAVIGLLALSAAIPWFRTKWRLTALCLPLASLLPLSGPGADGRFTATVLDVGQSEAIHLSYPDGTQGLVDTGGSSIPSANRFLARQVLARYLLNKGVKRLEFVLITHPESDHRGAYLELLQMVPVETTIHAESAPRYSDRLVRTSAGTTFSIGGIEHRILNPRARPAGGKSNENSIVMEIHYRNFRMLLTGDAPAAIERRLLDHLRPVDVLKVAHHGSRSSSSPVFLELLHPRIGLISAGRHNLFGHPSPKVVQRLETVGTRAFCTADSGSLRVSTDGKHWELATFTLKQGSFRTVDSGPCEPVSSGSLDPQE